MPDSETSESRVRRWFDQAANATPDERAEILALARAQDPHAAAELESLLLHLDRTGLIDSPPAGLSDLIADVPDEAAPERIGSFTIIREIGRGGMGVVYEAQQDYPRRRVALKLIRPELVRTSLLRRFVREAATLALLQHDGIARLYEAGFSDMQRRQPYICMELIEGSTISAYCASTSAKTRDILTLVALVCDAVDHAHRKGVVHRDLKPGNIFVTKEGLPKVLDFGVSRLTESDGQDYTATAPGHLIGTVGYMSPEQFGDDPAQVDQRSDVYALGVILYELLAGRPPLDFTRASITHAAAAIREQDAAPLGRVKPELRGDIEAIAGKALERSPASRYQSAADLAADIRRHLTNEPVLARAQTTWYQAQKFARRHRGLTVGLAAAMLALTVGIVGTTWQAIRATRNLEVAKEQELRATESANLMRKIIQAAAPENAQGSEPTVRQMLLKAEDELRANTTIHPVVAGDTHRMLTLTFAAMGDYERSARHAKDAMDLHAKSLGPEDRVTLADANLLAHALARLGRTAEAIEIAERALAIGIARYPMEHSTIRTASVLSLIYSESVPPNHERAFQMQKNAYEWSLATLGPENAMTILAESDMGLAYVNAGQKDEAIPLLRSALEKRRRLRGEKHPDTLLALSNLAFALDGTGDPKEELALHQKMVESARTILGPTHPRTFEFELNFALVLYRNKDLAAATDVMRKAAAAAEAKLGPTHKDTLKMRGFRTSLLIESKLLDEAVPEIDRHYNEALAAFGPADDRTLQSLTLYFDLAKARGSLPEMREVAAKLKGSQYADELNSQLKAAEEAAIASKPESKPDSK